AGTDVVSTDLIETIQINAFGGEDIVNIFNLTGTDVTRAVVDPPPSSGGPGDGRIDTITMNATSAVDTISVTSTAAGVVTVAGLAWTVEIRNFDGQDVLLIRSFGGDDIIDASGLDRGISLFVEAGDGDDVL